MLGEILIKMLANSGEFLKKIKIKLQTATEMWKTEFKSETMRNGEKPYCTN